MAENRKLSLDLYLMFLSAGAYCMSRAEFAPYDQSYTAMLDALKWPGVGSNKTVRADFGRCSNAEAHTTQHLHSM